MENVNSLGAYIRSITRAAGFRTMTPRLRQVLLGDDEEVTEEHRHLGHHEDAEDEGESSTANEQTPLIANGSAHAEDDNESTDLDPLHERVTGASQDRVQDLALQREETRSKMKDHERDALLVTKVRRDDGTEAEVIVGQSTQPQTIFNSSNTLIGVGILSLPLGIRYAGWVFGLGLLVASALVSKYSAGLLAKCIDVDSSLANFADIAYIAFGEIGRGTTSTLITLELLVACVGLVILFADTLGSLIPGPTAVHWKIICGCILAPLQFLPMSLLGFTSFLGVFCNIVIMVVGLIVGLLKAHQPGSLREVATTYAFPHQWKALPLSFGLIMDHTCVDVSMAAIGYLLYGDALLDEVTTNMIKTEGYSRAVKVTVLVMVAVVPITKFPLHAAPIVSQLEVFTGVDSRAALLKPNRLNQSKFLTKLVKAIFRLLVALIAIVFAIVVPSFELISALLGGLFGYLICVILPVGFHMKIFAGQISKRQLFLDWIYIAVAAVLGIVGTVWEFLPRDWMGL